MDSTPVRWHRGLVSLTRFPSSLAWLLLFCRLSLSVSEVTLFHASSSLFLPLLGPHPVAQGYGENASTELGSHPWIPLPCPSHPLGWRRERRRKGRGVGGGLRRGVLYLLCLSTGRWVLQGEGRYDVGGEGCEEKNSKGRRSRAGWYPQVFLALSLSPVPIFSLRYPHRYLRERALPPALPLCLPSPVASDAPRREDDS